MEEIALQRISRDVGFKLLNKKQLFPLAKHERRSFWSDFSWLTPAGSRPFLLLSTRGGRFSRTLAGYPLVGPAFPSC